MDNDDDKEHFNLKVNIITSYIHNGPVRYT